MFAPVGRNGGGGVRLSGEWERGSRLEGPGLLWVTAPVLQEVRHPRGVVLQAAPLPGGIGRADFVGGAGGRGRGPGVPLGDPVGGHGEGEGRVGVALTRPEAAPCRDLRGEWGWQVGDWVPPWDPRQLEGGLHCLHPGDVGGGGGELGDSPDCQHWGVAGRAEEGVSVPNVSRREAAGLLLGPGNGRLPHLDVRGYLVREEGARHLPYHLHRGGLPLPLGSLPRIVNVQRGHRAGRLDVGGLPVLHQLVPGVEGGGAGDHPALGRGYVEVAVDGNPPGRLGWPQLRQR